MFGFCGGGDKLAVRLSILSAPYASRNASTDLPGIGLFGFLVVFTTCKP